MKTIKGDLIVLAIAGEFDAIVHGCNCFNMMGAGIALQIKNTFPGAYEADSELDTKLTPYNKLGTLSHCKVQQYNDPNNVLRVTCEFDVVNAYTQYNGGRNLDYQALKLCLMKINHRYAGKKVGLPKIGCGIAGGDWTQVQMLIDIFLKDCDVTIVEYSN